MHMLDFDAFVEPVPSAGGRMRVRLFNSKERVVHDYVAHLNLSHGHVLTGAAIKALYTTHINHALDEYALLMGVSKTDIKIRPKSKSVREMKPPKYGKS